MKVKPLNVRIFLGSPGDVYEERKILYEEIFRYNSLHPSQKEKVRLTPVGWDREGRHIPLEASLSPQDNIEKTIPGPTFCDLVFIVFWSRMGRVMNSNLIKPLEYRYSVPDGENSSRYFSGTEYEFVSAMNESKRSKSGYPKVFIYKRKGFSNCSIEYEETDNVQRNRLTSFFKFLNNSPDGSIKTSVNRYNDLNHFRAMVRDTLYIQITSILDNQPYSITDREEPNLEVPSRWLTSPYPGLRALSQNDNDIFFGRENEVYEILERLRSNNFIAIVGGSGSGKSSLVMAGVLPNLLRGAILEPAGYHLEWSELSVCATNSAEWNPILFTPGSVEFNGLINPFDSFCSSVEDLLISKNSSCFSRTSFYEEIEKPLVKLRNNEEFSKSLHDIRNSINQFVTTILSKLTNYSLILIVIDQFEELFTLVDGKVVHPFLDFIDQLLSDSRVKIIITLRADFFQNIITHEAMSKRLRESTFTLTVPSGEDILRIISQPAEIAHLTFEKGLEFAILDDTLKNDGGLPLLAYLLDQLYEECKSCMCLTFKAYDRLGRVAGALSRRASSLMKNVKGDVGKKLGEIFKHLVEVDKETGSPTRRRAQKEILISGNKENASLIDLLINGRLLYADSVKTKSGNIDVIVEVAHEALLREWQPLANWIDTMKEHFAMRKKVESAVSEWMRSEYDERLLWDQSRMDDAIYSYKLLGYDFESLEDSIKLFLEPEFDRLVIKLNTHNITHKTRKEIGDRLSELNDNRIGVGVDDNGTPKIAWNSITAGDVQVIENSYKVQKIFVSRYPITVQQLLSFYKAKDGFYNTLLWKGLNSTPDNHPLHLPENQVGNHPAVWVSWFQALVFCRWLSKRLGFKVRIPFEWEWKRAAEGEVKNIYPWGNEWDPTRCNSVDSGLGNVTAVGVYPHGASNFGIEDLAGNVYEWCMNRFDLEKDNNTSLKSDSFKRTTKGGSYYIPPPEQGKSNAEELMKCSSRLGDVPSIPSQGKIRVGLRIVAESITV